VPYEQHSSVQLTANYCSSLFITTATTQCLLLSNSISELRKSAAHKRAHTALPTTPRAASLYAATGTTTAASGSSTRPESMSLVQKLILEQEARKANAAAQQQVHAVILLVHTSLNTSFTVCVNISIASTITLQQAKLYTHCCVHSVW
jgi:hypothetical protein